MRRYNIHKHKEKDLNGKVKSLPALMAIYTPYQPKKNTESTSVSKQNYRIQVNLFRTGNYELIYWY